MRQCSRHNLDILLGLSHFYPIFACCQSCICAILLRLLQIDIVLNTFYAYFQFCFMERKRSFHTSTEYLVEIFVPPSIARVKRLIVKSWRLIANKSARFECEGISPQLKVQSCLTFQIKLSPVHTSCSHFTQNIVAEML